MSITKDYIKKSVDAILKIDPSLDKDDVEKIVSSKIKERIKNPVISMDNNVTNINEKISLTELCSWIDKKKPIIAGNGTFYMQPSVLKSPTSNMLKTLKVNRKTIKFEMFQAEKSGDYETARDLDLDQSNEKVIMNAEYGGSGAPTSAFYTKYSPAATTLMAQSIITTMAAFFEGFIGDNQKFFSINECIDWMNKVISKDDKINNWIQIPSVHDVIIRIKSHFIIYDLKDDYVIENYIKNCNSSELVYLYYANNIKDFIKNHSKIKDFIKNILTLLPLHEVSYNEEIPELFKNKFEKVIEYNEWVSQEMFMNPYKIPDCIKSQVSDLKEFINQYVFVEYLTPDSIMKLNNHKRNMILLVDTDSNVINADIFVKFILDEIFSNISFNRESLYNEIICVNLLASILDSCVGKILNYYGILHNMDEESRKELVMKNEFMFRILLLMNKKKRYSASVVLREGNIMIPFKTEIKGIDFIKAGVTDTVTNKLTKILEDYILRSDTLELNAMMKELKQFEKDIYNDLKSGGVQFLKPQQYKPEAAYKKIYDKVTGREISRAWSIPVFRAASVWNEIYPTKKIYSLDRVSTIKLIVTCVEDLDIIKTKYPEDYNMIVNKIFKSNNPDIVKAGLKVIAIPNTVKKIPEWIIDLIDYEVIISDVISSFRSILEAMKLEIIYVKTPNGKAAITNSLIAI